MCKISILLPTRGRPSRLNDLIESINKTADNLQDVEIIIKIDNDDGKTIDYLDRNYFSNLVIVASQRAYPLSDAWNLCWEQSSGDILFLGGDDLIFRTDGWDTEVVNEFKSYEDKILLLYCKDGPRNTMTHGFIHKRWTDTVGYFTPPGMDYANDSWLETIARKINRIKFREDIYIEHMHWAFRKREKDETDMALEQQWVGRGGKKVFLDENTKLEADAQKLIDVMI